MDAVLIQCVAKPRSCRVSRVGYQCQTKQLAMMPVAELAASSCASGVDDRWQSSVGSAVESDSAMLHQVSTHSAAVLVELVSDSSAAAVLEEVLVRATFLVSLAKSLADGTGLSSVIVTGPSF